MSLRLSCLGVPVAEVVRQADSRLQALVDSLAVVAQLGVDEGHRFAHGLRFHDCTGVVEVTFL